MDARLLDYYNRELAYLRELGAEFAAEFPQAAGRLGMRGIEVSDPYVERLLEGFSFLTARIQLKMDAEFPRFSQRLLDVVYPNYLAPLPSMTIVAVQPNLREGSLQSGYTLPAGTSLRGNLAAGEQTACEFSTAHALTLWPLRITGVRLGAVPADLPLPHGELASRARSALHIQLEASGVGNLRELPLDSLTFFLSGPDNQALPLLEQVLGHHLGVICHGPSAPGRPGHTGGACSLLDGEALRQEGFDAAQALLPHSSRAFQGYRLLHEYFAFPQRFLFFSIGSLQRALQDIDGTTFSLTILLDEASPELERSVDQRSLALFCTPAINLFPKRTDRIAITSQHYEHHVVVDRTRPLDYEIYGVEKVTGHRQSDGGHCEFRPFYGGLSPNHDPGAGHADAGRYFSLRREARLVAPRASLASRAPRSSTQSAYAGSEIFVSLVDQHEAPFSDDLRHLCVDAMCTNRDLALLMPTGAASDFTLRTAAPVASIQALRRPTPPQPPLAENEITWRLVKHLGLDYLTLTDLDDQQGAQALRELLELYAGATDADIRPQIGGIRSVRIEPACRQLPQAGPPMFGRGVAVSLLLDETAFAGASTYLFGAVLEQFFARHVSLNSFSELAVATLQQGHVKRWPPRIGRRPTA
jgi:type VI secretion system protein ImpG